MVRIVKVACTLCGALHVPTIVPGKPTKRICRNCTKAGDTSDR